MKLGLAACLLAIAGLLLAACSSDTARPGTYAALCEIGPLVDSGNLAAADDEFLDTAHQDLHELSAELAGADRAAAERVLLATERFEAQLAERQDPEAAVQSLELLLFEVEAAQTLLGSEEAATCTDSNRAAGGTGIVAEVASYDLAVGDDERLLIGVFGNDLTFLSFGEITLELRHDDEKVSEHTARFLPVPGHGEDAGVEARTPSLTRPSEARGVYEATGVGFHTAGIWEVAVTAEVDGETQMTSTAFEVASEHAVFAAGELAPRTDNPVLGDEDTAPGSVDSRADADGLVPDPELHEASVVDHLDAGRPVVVVVSTPVFCVSRFCGPITDAVGELADAYQPDVGFVHLEVWEDFSANVLNPSATEWIWPGQQGDPAEPWVFLVDGDGRVVHRWDNVVDLDELRSALDALVRQQ